LPQAEQIRGLQPLTKADWELVDATIEQVGISHLSSKPIGHLSGGERQKTSIARALAQQAPILLLDEPTASIDPNAQKDILKLIDYLAELNQFTTLYVTHEVSMIPDKCERIIMLQNGKLWADGSPEKLITEEILKDFTAEMGLLLGKFAFKPPPLNQIRIKNERDIMDT
jgi:ABC-type cobalamin/Fe3+-siderophores transport system ATPase subunit